MLPPPALPPGTITVLCATEYTVSPLIERMFPDPDIRARVVSYAGARARFYIGGVLVEAHPTTYTDPDQLDEWPGVAAAFNRVVCPGEPNRHAEELGKLIASFRGEALNPRYQTRDKPSGKRLRQMLTARNRNANPNVKKHRR